VTELSERAHTAEGPRLDDPLRGKKNIVIISSDHTRPVPSKIITPILLRRIRAAQPDTAIKTPTARLTVNWRAHFALLFPKLARDPANGRAHCLAQRLRQSHP
jgi:hypothetical protein